MKAEIKAKLFNRFRNVRSVVKSKSKRLKLDPDENDAVENSDNLNAEDGEDDSKNHLHANEVINTNNTTPKGLCETIYLDGSGEVRSYFDENDVISEEEEYAMSSEDKSESESSI